MKKKISMLIANYIFLFLHLQSVYAGKIEDELGIEADPIAVDNAFAGRFFGYFQVSVYILAIFVVLYIGIRYLLAAADDKAELKKAFYKYFVGIVLVVAATTIASFVFNLK